MNRYGIPKQDSVELKDNVNNSSSGGGGSGSDVKYYTFNMNNMPESWADMLLILLSLIPLYKYTYRPMGEGIEKYIVGSAHFIDNLNRNGTKNVIAVAYMPTYSYHFYYPTLKDIFIGAELDVTDFDKIFTPITEEEFYDLNKWTLEDYK